MDLAATIRDIAADTARKTTRELIAPDTLYVSQRTAEAILGMHARAYLDLVRRPDCPVEILRVGKLRLAELAPFVAWLRVLGLHSAAESPEPEHDSEDRFLAELGLRVAK